MYHDRKGMRSRAADKANRLAYGDPHQKVDASSWTPPEPMNPDVQTGMRPVSKRQFKRGGKVAHMEGHKAKHHVGHKPRKSGGRAPITADTLINRSVKDANVDREGVKHVGAMKRGGAAHGHISHADEVADKKLIKSMVKGTALKRGKFGGGPVGDNPISIQNKMMGQAAGTRKRGGATKMSQGGVLPMPSAQDMRNFAAGQRPSFAAPAPSMSLSDLQRMAPQLPQGGMAQMPSAQDMQNFAAGQRPSFAAPTPSMSFADLQRMAPPMPQGGMSPQDMTMARKSGGRAHHATDGKVPLPPPRPADKVPMPPSRMDDVDTKGLSPEQLEMVRKGQDPYAEGQSLVRAHKRGGKADGHKVKWIQGAIKHPGALHKALHVPAGEKIPMAKIKKAEHSSNPKLAKRAHMAETLRSFHTDGGKAGHGPECRCKKCWGGAAEAKGDRIARKSGGSTKGKTHINIMIAPHGAYDSMGAGAGAPAMPPAMPPRPPMGGPAPMPMGALPPGLGTGIPPMPPPGVKIPAGRPPMGRKSGGRTGYPIETGAGGGEARLDKIKAYGLTPPRSARGR
jgi:hypothetical protein